MKCRDKLCSKEEIELRVLPEPDNVRDKNALIFKPKSMISGIGLDISQRNKCKSLLWLLETMK